MNRHLSILSALIVLILAAPAMAADSLLITSGAGYKTVVEALATAFTTESGVPVERIYGNMAQIMGQAQNSGKVDLVVGEESFLRASSLPLDDATPMGVGRLVLAWPKGKPEPSDLKAPAVGRIAIADPKKAIYGKAAMEYLERSGQHAALKDKVLIVGTVPQVFTYLSTGEVDAGFLNLTQVLAVKEQLGGYREMDATLYAPIAITCFQLKTAPNSAAATDFARFLGSEKAKSILAAHGL
jgi:molybdate transport system substrate-binding protein